jgi:dipeptidyl aminopeptidase/acylaminoacyl peptidase
VHVRDVEGNRYATFETSEGFWAALDFSADGSRVLLLQYLSANRSRLFELNVATSQAVALFDDSVEAAFGMAQYDGADDVFFTADLGAEFMRLHHLERATGRIEVITGDVPWNVEYFQISANDEHLAYSVNEDGRSRLVVVSLPARQFVALPELPMGVIRGFAFSADGQRLALNLSQPTAPTDVHVLDLGSRELVRWTRSETGGLAPSGFVEPVLIRYPSFDARQIPAFVYLPDGPGPHPVVIYIHGGPESQYRPVLSSNFQYLVNELGIAVIAPNVRGSRGYGKSYLKLDDQGSREDSVKDIGALLTWITNQGELDAQRTGVWGGSYGGYMVLASLVHFGDRLAAGAASVGISNFVTFLEHTQPYRRDLRRVEYGDERDPDMRAHLEAISPLRRAGEITTPGLISHGKNDPRVPMAESEQIVAELESNGVPVWYVLALDEGHGFKKRGNRDYLNAVTMLFFATHLTDAGG